MANKRSLFKIQNTPTVKRESPESSCVSMKSTESKDKPVNFRESSADGSSNQEKHPDSSCVSVKSTESIDKPVNFRKSSADLSNKQDGIKSLEKKQLDSTFKELKTKIIRLMDKELKRFKRLLSTDCPACSEKEQEEVDEGHDRVKEGMLKITLHMLRKMNQTDLANMLQTKCAPLCQEKLKFRLKEKFLRINEGISNPASSTLLNEIYTELYITQGGTGEVNNEHEVRQIEKASRRQTTQETPIKCNNIFKDILEESKPIRTVLTKGIAGIGKTVSVQKFVLDWVEGNANEDVHYIFPLPFRELNLMKEKNISLMELLYLIFKDSKELRPTDYEDYKILFIFDGLDECRLPLDFSKNPNLSNVTESASVDVLMTNLIKGNLLPSALLWITSRPAAANLIPPEFVDQVTEVRGFKDLQKDEYFKKRINDQVLANKIITHIKSSRSLYIMCYIPVFCWISATVLERIFCDVKCAEIPKTLTQMFTHFLIFQTKLKSQKYDGEYEVDLHLTQKKIISLGKLAFEQLEKGNLIFYEADLTDCGIDVREALVYSGICTQLFREEFALYLGKMYSFVHLSIQEFLAAVFKFFIENKDQSSKEFLKSEVNRAMESGTGHLDLYLRFLLGFSSESNQTLLRDMLGQTDSISSSQQEIVEYIKMHIRENPSPEKSINLFHCLNELNDHSLVQEVQTYLKKTGAGRLSGAMLSPSQWSALVFVLLNSDEELDEFNLNKYDQTEECLLRLLPVVKTSKKADLSNCGLTEKGCLALASALSSSSVNLRELNLSNNNLEDSGQKRLSTGLKNPHCKLKTLKLSGCLIREEGCATLASALSSNPSHLKELDLNCNKLGDSGVKFLSAALPHCKLEKLQLMDCNIGEEGCIALASALRSNPSHIRELNLNYSKPGCSGIKELSALLKDQHCKLMKLELFDCSIGEEDCAALISAIKSNPSHLRDLNLNYNEPGESGMKLLSNLLRDPCCKLEKLKLCDCGIKEKGFAALASALRSNPSHLRKLVLSCNKLGDSGMKELSALLKDPNCKLQQLRLWKCKIGEKGCTALASALSSNPSHLTKLNLNDNKLGDSVKRLSHLLQEPQCKLGKLLLSKCSIGEEGCIALTSALMSNPSHLRQLNLNNNTPGHSGVKQISDLLQNPDFKLEKLCLSDCSITEEDCFALASALRLNPSQLKLLNLTKNKLGDSGVSQIHAVQSDPRCELQFDW